MVRLKNLFQKRQSPAIVVIAFAAVAAMVISFSIGMRQSVWFDEAYSILVARHDVGDILQLASVDTHPPGYYLMLHGWGNMFGWDEPSLRLLSVLALGTSVIIAGLLVRRMFGDRAAMTTVVLLTVSPFLLRYGFEIRMYATASLIGMLATYVLVAARANAGKWAWRWVLYALLVAAGMLTLYHLALLWVAHVVWLIMEDRRRLRRPWLLPWVYAYIGAAVVFLPWLPKFIGQLGNGALANIGQPMNLEQLGGILTFNLFYQPSWQTGATVAAVVLAVIAGAAWAWRRVYALPQYRAYMLLLTLYIAVPILIFMFATFWRPLYVERYLSQVAIGLIMLLGVLLAVSTRHLRTPYQVAAFLALGAVMVAGVYHLANIGNFNFQRMEKPAAATIASTIDCTGATVIAADPYIATELGYYLPPTCDLRFYSDWTSLTGGYAPLNDSPLRFTSTKVPRSTSRLYYAYYAKPELNINPSYTKTASYSDGGITVETYEAGN